MENQSFIVCSSSILSIIETQSFDGIFMTIISINPYLIKLSYLIPSLITLYFTIVWCYSIIWKSIIKTYYLTFIWLFNFFDLFLKICYNVKLNLFCIICKATKALIEAIFLKLIYWLFSMLIKFLKNSYIWYFQYVLSVNQEVFSCDWHYYFLILHFSLFLSLEDTQDSCSNSWLAAFVSLRLHGTTKWELLPWCVLSVSAVFLCS